MQKYCIRTEIYATISICKGNYQGRMKTEHLQAKRGRDTKHFEKAALHYRFLSKDDDR